MKRLIPAILTALAVALFAFFLASPAHATGKRGDCNGIANCNKSTQYGGDGGSADARSVAGALSVANGSAKATAKGGNARAYGGHAKQAQGQFQVQGLRSSNKTNVGVGQRTDVGLYAGNKVQASTGGNSLSTVVEGDNYQAPKKPDVMAYAPDVNPSPATAPCLVPWGVSGGSGAALISLGASGAAKDHGCALGEVARRAADVGRQDIADTAVEYMFALVLKEAGLEGQSPAQVAGQESVRVVPGGYEDPFAGIPGLEHGTD